MPNPRGRPTKRTKIDFDKAALGTMHDQDLALILGCCRSYVTMERNKRGIPPYREPVSADEEPTYTAARVTRLEKMLEEVLDRLEDLRRAIRPS